MLLTKSATSSPALEQSKSNETNNNDSKNLLFEGANDELHSKSCNTDSLKYLLRVLEVGDNILSDTEKAAFLE